MTGDSAPLLTSDSPRSTHVALLRGINLGGKNAVPMAELRRYAEEAGGANARTYVQSGNLVFTAQHAAPIAAVISARIEENLGLTIPVVLVTADELRDIAAGNPYLREGVPEKEVHLILLSETPPPDRVANLDPDRSPPDRYTVAGRAIYHHAPNGLARTKLTNAYLDRTLGVVSTSRNWRTIGSILALCADHT